MNKTKATKNYFHGINKTRYNFQSQTIYYRLRLGGYKYIFAKQLLLYVVYLPIY